MITAKDFIKQVHIIQTSDNYSQRMELADYMVALHNRYCEEVNAGEEYIYENTEENLEMILGDNVYEAFLNGLFSDYHYNDDYFIVDGYGHIKTVTTAYIEDLSDWEVWLEEYQEESGDITDITDISEVFDIICHFNFKEEEA